MHLTRNRANNHARFGLNLQSVQEIAANSDTSELVSSDIQIASRSLVVCYGIVGSELSNHVLGKTVISVLSCIVQGCVAAIVHVVYRDAKPVKDLEHTLAVVLCGDHRKRLIELVSHVDLNET